MRGGDATIRFRKIHKINFALVLRVDVPGLDGKTIASDLVGGDMMYFSRIADSPLTGDFSRV